jgi:hypothetical protein
MAYRIHDHVTHGEIDCRVKGEITGKLWLHGGGEPVVLKLSGNAWPDMAGCLLSFVNKSETSPPRGDSPLERLQEGAAGDMTASRKVRVPAVPIDEFCEMTMRGEKPPERLANSLYLEWFSESNGRVVLESSECEITLSTPKWRLTPEEEEQRAADAAAGLDDFMGKLTEAIEIAEAKVPWGKEEWDEFDHEKLLRESDARTDKFGELMEKYMDHPDRDRIIAREMGWDHIIEMLDEKEAQEKEGVAGQGGEAQADDEPHEDSKSDECAADEGDEPQPDPATEGTDWVRTKDGDIKHPLSNRAFESAMALWDRIKELGLKDDLDEDLGTLWHQFCAVGAKLAGALDGLALDRSIGELAHNIARMKRGLTHLHAAQAALRKVEDKQLLPPEDLEHTRSELFGIREEMLRLMEEFRNKPGK